MVKLRPRGDPPLNNHNFMIIDFCSYNVRGLNLKQTSVKDFICGNKLSLVALLETKVNKDRAEFIAGKIALRFSWKFNYSHHPGGWIWVGWDRLIWRLDVLSSSAQHMSCKITNLDSNLPMFVSFVYGHNTYTDRKMLWEDLINFSTIDLRGIGSYFTWRDKSPNTLKFRKIDRVLVNAKWLSDFPLSYANFLPRGVSDHCPAAHPQFIPIVSEAWNCSIEGDPWWVLTNKLKRVEFALIRLNKDMGNVCTASRPAHNALLDFQNSLPQHPSLSQIENEALLISKYNEANCLEEELLRQKSRVMAFIPKRTIGDNIMLAQALCRDCHLHSGKPRCTIKLDIHKAFDSINWNFLDSMLTRIGFPHQFKSWIMRCITTCMSFIKINGSLEGFFSSKSGLQQGDALSPYLFVLAMEVFSAYDILLFCKGDAISTSMLMNGVTRFATIPGLRPSLEKSNVFYGNVNEGEIQNITAATGINSGTLPIRYLGLPLITGKLNVAHCQPLLAIMVRTKQTTRKSTSRHGVDHLRAQQRAHSSSSALQSDTIPFSIYADLMLHHDTLQGKYVRLMEGLEELYASKQVMGNGPKAKTISRLESLIQVATSRLEEMPVHRDRTSQITVQMIVDELGSMVEMLHEDTTPDTARTREEESEEEA
ncbi:uncharacterized protein LOC141695520 [Apium graveolens]|uniref:uncharacterized protein LOC141695520 n=1 Tax=Apium graveolens TaxID=4045 RepID=UPI003D799406